MGEKDPWVMVEAIGTLLAVAVAALAFVESLRMRKNSAFNALFSQLIANHKDAFADKTLSTGFYTYYIKHKESVRTIYNLVNMWDSYKKQLEPEKSARFSQACKYVYHEVCTVYNEVSVDEKAKRHYIGIIQSLMNKHELFCYLVSLLQHFENYPEDKNDYREQLKQYNFFADIMRKHDPLYTDLMEYLYNQLYIDIHKIIMI